MIFHNKVTVLQSTPSLFLRRWSPERLSNTILGKDSPLRIILLGGEPFPKIDLIIANKHIENRTEFFNIYGITEVSCWASINRITWMDKELESSYLGTVLSETIFQVRNEDDSIVSNGDGHLYIGNDFVIIYIYNDIVALIILSLLCKIRIYFNIPGSNSRICVIDDEVLQNIKRPVFRKTGDIVRVSYSFFFVSLSYNSYGKIIFYKIS